MLILIGIATFFSTLLGGLFALRLKDRLHLVLGFSAGAIIGVAFFDLMPEAFEIGTKVHSPSFITTIIAVGFLVYLVLDRAVVLHGHHEDKDQLRRGVWAPAVFPSIVYWMGRASGLRSRFPRGWASSSPSPC